MPSGAYTGVPAPLSAAAKLRTSRLGEYSNVLSSLDFLPVYDSFAFSQKTRQFLKKSFIAKKKQIS